MEDQNLNQQANTQKKVISKRKLINKVHKKIKRQEKKLLQSYQNTRLKIGDQKTNQSGNKGMSSLLDGSQAMDFDMMNHISMGQNRKLKKKMKKLKKKNLDNDQIFQEMKKTKDQFYKNHEKKIFNGINQLQKRRQKRAKQRQMNAKRYKSQVRKR